MIPFEIPITLGRDEAQRQLQAELSKPEYLDAQNVLNDWWRRLFDWLAGGAATGQPSLPVVPLIVAVIVILALVALILLAGPLRHDTQAKTDGDMFAGLDTTAGELRDEAVRLGSSGQWTQATIQRFRALIRSLGERGVIEESAGMTAHEAAGRAGERLPALSDSLGRAAAVFDALAYGTRTGTKRQYDEMTALDEDVARARPVLATADEPLEPETATGTRVTTDEAVQTAAGHPSSATGQPPGGTST